jgi:LysR family transcriptional regulator, glycine cleavage system transcriptional activator
MRLPLKDIEAFVMVARAGSLAQAATIMHLTVPALSRRIQQLEADLGTRLFERRPRGLVLTDAGRDYFTALDPSWETLSRATEALRKRGQRKDLVVTVMPTFAANWLVPRLPAFQARHRAVGVELHTSGETEDLNARSELDCAIRLGRGPWPGTTSEPLLQVRAVPVASPKLLEETGRVREPAELLSRRLIGTHHQIEFWQEWFAAHGIHATPENCVAFDNLQVVYEAAAAGMGIALGLEPLVRSFLASGRLLPLFAERVCLQRQFHLARRAAGARPSRHFSRFRDWLFAEAEHFTRAGA